MNIEVIALDLDGTALCADHLSFSPRLERALLAAHRRGVAVLPVTGRQFPMLPPALRRGAEWEGLAVLCNGSEIRRLEDGRLLLAHYLEREVLLRLLAAAEDLSLPVELSAGGCLYLTAESLERERRIGDRLRFHLEVILREHGRVEEDLAELCRRAPEPFDKVNLPHVPEERRRETEAALDALPVSWAWSGPWSIEITHEEATKAQGMREACRLLGRDSGRTLAIGDSGNDITMLRAAGLGVAMGGAPAEVRAAADAVTAANEEDGAALAIERYVLGTG